MVGEGAADDIRMSSRTAWIRKSRTVVTRSGIFRRDG
jgi:hypothetical protein